MSQLLSILRILDPLGMIDPGSTWPTYIHDETKFYVCYATRVMEHPTTLTGNHRLMDLSIDLLDIACPVVRWQLK
jgi:hypothetical protein